jgi:hypothetical protein
MRCRRRAIRTRLSADVGSEMKAMSAICAIAAGFVLAGCGAGTLRPEDMSQCSSQGGDWRRVCVAQEYACVLPYRDAGKTCGDSSECEGECLIDSLVICEKPGRCSEPPEVPSPGTETLGTCQRDNNPCGSFAVVRNGKVEPVFHAD